MGKPVHQGLAEKLIHWGVSGKTNLSGVNGETVFNLGAMRNQFIQGYWKTT